MIMHRMVVEEKSKLHKSRCEGVLKEIFEHGVVETHHVTKKVSRLVKITILVNYIYLY